MNEALIGVVLTISRVLWRLVPRATYPDTSNEVVLTTSGVREDFAPRN